MGLSVTPWELPGSDGQPIYGNTHWPEDEAIGQLVCCHGFKGYKDYGFFPVLCDYAAQHGLAAHRFNFSHSGMTNRLETFERPDLFEKDRWSRQVEDLGAVLTHLHDTAALPLVVFGHSRGGVTGTLYSGHGERLEPQGLIAAAAPDYACKLDDLVKNQFRAEGRLLSPSGRTGQDLYVGLDWLEEIERDPQGFDPVRAASQVNCPLLILHGDDDDTVPLDCAYNLHNASIPNSQLHIIEGANHVFNCPNPLPQGAASQTLPEQTHEMILLSVGFAVSCCSQPPRL